MVKNDLVYETYVEILREELVPAMGCTEPIAIAYCASKLRDTLNGFPSELEIYVSGNIIKNVKSVTVPNTNGKHGIEAAACIGIVAGDSSKELEVIVNAKKESIDILDSYM